MTGAGNHAVQAVSETVVVTPVLENQGNSSREAPSRMKLKESVAGLFGKLRLIDRQPGIEAAPGEMSFNRPAPAGLACG